MIRFHKPTIRRKDMNAVLETMVDEKIGPGERKKLFSADLCEMTGKKYALILRSYFDALSLALQSAGIGRGDSVGMSLLSPRIYASVCQSLGISVRYGDIDPSTGCLSAEEALKLEGMGVKAILLHEPSGMIPYHEDFSALTVPLIEDITQSIGSSYPDTEDPSKTEKAGDRGSVLVCAFEEGDMISAGGGAAVLTSVKDYRDIWSEKLEGIRPWIEMPDMNAALAVIQYDLFSEQVAKRREFYRAFRQGLLRTHHKPFGISAVDYDINGYGFPVFLDSKIEDVMEFAKKYSVPTVRTFGDCVGRDKKDDIESWPNAVPRMIRTLSFPIYPFIGKEDRDTLVKVISHLP